MCNTRDAWSMVVPPVPVPLDNAVRRDQPPGPRHRPGRDGGMARLVRRRRRRPGAVPGALPAHEAPRAGAHQAGRLPRHGLDALREHHPRRRRALVPRRRVPGAPDPRLHPLERGRHGHPGQRADRGHRRAPLDLRQLGRALRGRLQPLLPRQGRRRLRRPGLLPGPRLARHLRPGLCGGQADRGRSSTTSATKSAATACRATRTRARSRTSGSSRPSRWASARSPPSTRRTSTAT